MSTTPPTPDQQKAAATRQPVVNIDYINFFIEAVVSTFNAMIGATPVRTKIMMKGDKDEGLSMYGVSGVIDLAGEASGSVVLTFNEDTAKNVVGKMTGATYSELTADVVDGIGELTGVIAGDAKNRLSQKGYNFTVGLPTVISGRNFITTRTKGVPCIVILFSSPVGGLSLEVCLKKS